MSNALLLNGMFSNPALQTERLLEDLRKELSEDMVAEIEALVMLKIIGKFESIENNLFKRYKEINATVDKMGRCKTKKDKNVYLKEYFNLVNPSAAANDLKKHLVFDEIEGDYSKFLDEMASREYGKPFLRYKWTDNVYKALQAGLLDNVKDPMKALEAHGEALNNHFELLKEIKAGTIARTGIRLAGSMIAGLPGSLIARALTNEDDRIYQSLTAIETKWNEYTNTLQACLTELKIQYRHILLTLYGGTLINANRDLKVFGLEFIKLNLMANSFTLVLTKEEHERTAKWGKETQSSIEMLFRERKYEQASAAVSKLLEFLKANPVISENTVIDGKNIMYLALTYRIALTNHTLKRLAGENRQAYDLQAKEYFEKLSILPDDDYIDRLGCPPTVHIILEYTSISIKSDNTPRLMVFNDYLLRMIERGSGGELYQGETAYDRGLMGWCISMLLMYLRKAVPGSNTILDNNADETFAPAAFFKNIRRSYIKHFGDDAFCSFLKAAARKSMFARFEKVFFRKRLLVPASVAVLLIVLLGFSPDHYEYLKDFTTGVFGIGEKTEAVQTESLRHIYPTVDAANIREHGGKANPVVAVALRDEILTYLGEEMIDPMGTVWYKVKNDSGVTGWISSEVAELQ